MMHLGMAVTLYIVQCLSFSCYALQMAKCNYYIFIIVLKVETYDEHLGTLSDFPKQVRVLEYIF